MRTPFLVLATLCSAPVFAQDIPLTINGREYLLPPTTAIRLRGVDTIAAALADAPNGLQVQWSAASVRGAQAELIFAYTLEGPITSIEPLAVLGQPVTRDGNTVHEGLTAATTLSLGQAISVAGLVDANGSLLATLVELPEGPLDAFALTGYVHAVAENGDIQVGQQWVSPGAMAPLDCPNGLSLGSYVSLTADPVDPFPPNSILGNLTTLRCTQPVAIGTAGASGWVQGLVSVVEPSGNFLLGDLTVQVGPTTTYRFGTSEDIDEGSALSVDGTFIDSQTFAASAIEFAHQIVRFEAPLSPEQVAMEESTAPFGLLVRSTAQLRDDDGIVSGGLTEATQVQVRGYLDQTGGLWMTRVRERGNPDLADTSLRAPVSSMDGTTLMMLGIAVDTSQAVFLDMFENPITPEQFFSALQMGDSVEVAAATWIPAETRLIAGEVGIARVIPPGNSSVRGTSSAVVSGTASGYQRAAALFSSGFESN